MTAVDYSPFRVRQCLSEIRETMPALVKARREMTLQWEVVARTTATMAERRMRDEKRWGATVDQMKAKVPS